MYIIISNLIILISKGANIGSCVAVAILCRVAIEPTSWESQLNRLNSKINIYVYYHCVLSLYTIFAYHHCILSVLSLCNIKRLGT